MQAAAFSVLLALVVVACCGKGDLGERAGDSGDCASGHCCHYEGAVPTTCGAGADAQDPAPAAADDEAAAVHLLQRRGGYRLGAAAAAEGHAPAPEAEPLTALPHPDSLVALGARLARLDVLGALVWRLPDKPEPRWLFALAALYASLPAAVAYGVVILLGGSGSIQVLATMAYWGLLRPAAGALEALCLLHAGRPAAAVGLPAAHATAAHFYWAWGALELAARRRPLWQRLAAVAFLGLLLLPVPFAQVLLLERSPGQVAAGALLGEALGVAFFFGLRASGVWGRLQASRDAPRAGTWLGHWLQPWDNLTGFWGGSLCEPLALAARGARGK